MATASCSVESLEGLSFGLGQGIRGLIWAVLEFFFSVVFLLRVVVLGAAGFVAKGLPEASRACSLHCHFSCSCCSRHSNTSSQVPQQSLASRAGRDEDFQSANPHWQGREDKLFCSNHFRHRAEHASPKASQSCASKSGGAGSSSNYNGQHSEDIDQWECIRGLQQELEEERIAAESAAKAALGQIVRLHHEKAAIQMELQQYRRMSEERFQHDATRVELLQQQLARAEDFAAALSRRLPSNEDHRLGLQRAMQTPRVALARLESSVSSGAFQTAADVAEGIVGRSTRSSRWRAPDRELAGVLSEAAFESSSATGADQPVSSGSSLALIPSDCRTKGVVRMRKGQAGQLLGRKLASNSENAGVIRRASSEGCIFTGGSSGCVSRPALPGGAMRRRPLRALSTQLPAEADKCIPAALQALPEKGTSQIESPQQFDRQITIRPATQGRGYLLKGREERCEQVEESMEREQSQECSAASQDAGSRTVGIRYSKVGADFEPGRGVEEVASPSSPQRPAEAMELINKELPVVCEPFMESSDKQRESIEEAHLQLGCAQIAGGDTVAIIGTLGKAAGLDESTVVAPDDTGSLSFVGRESKEVEEFGDKAVVQAGERPLVAADWREKDVGSPQGHQELVQKLLKWQRRASLGELVASDSQEQKDCRAASDTGQSEIVAKEEEESKCHLKELSNARQAPAGPELEPLIGKESGGNRVQDLVQQLTRPQTSVSESGRCKAAGPAQLQERFLSRLRQAGAENELEVKLARRRQKEAKVGAAESAQESGPDWPKISQVIALGPVEEELGAKLARRRHWEGFGGFNEGLAQSSGVHNGASKGGGSSSEAEEMSFRTPATAPYAEQTQSGGYVTPSSLAWNQNTPAGSSPDSPSPSSAIKTALCKMSELGCAEMSSEGSSPGGLAQGSLVHPWPGTPPPVKALEGGFEATPDCTCKAPGLETLPASNSPENSIEGRSSGEDFGEGKRGWSDVDRKLEELDGCVKGLEARQD